MKKTVKLNDILSITRGASPRPISNYITNESDGVNWIKIGDVDPNSFFITHTEEKITKEGAKKSRYVKEGDFILSNSMSFGRPYILKINGCVHDGWLILSDYENYVTSSYLYYLLRSPIVQNQFDGSANGATVRNLNSDIVRKVSVSIHTDKTEQQKIAAHLDTIQSAIDNKKQQLAQLDELVKSKFVEMFGETPVESGKWKVETLGSKSELITKGASPRWQGVEYQSEGTLFVTSENVREGYVDLTKSKYLPDEINEILPRSILRKNDVLINIVGASIGRAAIYEFEKKANINQAVALVRLNSSDLDRTFLLIYLNSELAMKLYQSMIKGGARDNLSLKNISDLSIPVPPIELQNDFATFVQKIDSAKSIIKTQLNDLNELLESKMDFYFGE